MSCLSGVVVDVGEVLAHGGDASVARVGVGVVLLVADLAGVQNGGPCSSSSLIVTVVLVVVVDKLSTGWPQMCLACLVVPGVGCAWFMACGVRWLICPARSMSYWGRFWMR